MNEPDTEFLEIFRDEALERLDRIVAMLIALESGTSSAEVIDSLFRDTHTIKGAAGMVGLDDVRQLAHAMEDVLTAARDRATLPIVLISPLLRAADALRAHVEGVGEPVVELCVELSSLAAGIDGAASEQVSPDMPAVDRDARGGLSAPSFVELPDESTYVAGIGGSTDVAAHLPPSPTSSAPERATLHSERRAIRVSPEKIDQLLDLVGETVLHRRRLEHVLELADAGGQRAVSDELDVGERLFDGLKVAAIGMRTLPLSTVVGSLPRAVRDLAAEANKDVELVITGADTELDRAILESLSEPLVHVLRNAIAHGIEGQLERERLGKPRRARLELRAEQRGGMVEITVADDGRGVSAEILARAESVGSLAEVLATPGFSTAGSVSDISGRGVGLDAVKAHVESFGGSLDVRSATSCGTEVVLRLPLALALLDVLLVERAGNVYGLPLASVEEAVTPDQRLSLGGRPALELRGRSVPLADLASLVGDSAEAPSEQAPAIVVAAASGHRVAAICDTLLGKEEVVVKSLGPFLQSVSTYLGAAILGDGRIALLVDPAALIHASRRPKLASPGRSPFTETTASVTPKVLVVEDSFTVRELQRSILEAAGYRVDTARDGRDALDRLSSDDTIELVLTDFEMPEMDGIELTERIRADEAHSALPVVIVTSRDEEVTRRRGIEAGADAYMVKHSFDQQALLETVERLVGR